MTECELDTCLPAQAAASLPTSSSGMSLSLPSSGTPTPARSCASDSPACESSKAMCDPWTSPENWLASMRSALASLVRTSAQQEKALELKASEAASIAKSCEQLTLFSLPGSSSKTHRSYEPEADTSSSPTWWRVDIPGETDSLPRLMLAPRTSEIAGGALRDVPTPTVCGNYNRKGASKSSGDGLATWVAKWPTPTASLASKGGRVTPRKARNGGTLIEAVSAHMFATPTARDWRSGKASEASEASEATMMKNSRPLSEQIGGLLNPEWVEWLMGWPIGHTASAHWVTDKSRLQRLALGSVLVALGVAPDMSARAAIAAATGAQAGESHE